MDFTNNPGTLKYTLILLVLLVSKNLSAREGDTVIVSPKVGAQIDSAEKTKYRILPYYSSKIFISAAIFRDTDSTFLLKALLKPDSISERKISGKELEWIRSSIDSNYAAQSAKNPLRSADSIYFYRRIHFYSGSRGRVRSIQGQLEETFGGSNYGTLVSIRHGDIWSYWCETYINAGAQYEGWSSPARLGAAYQFSPYFKAGLEIGGGSKSRFSGSKGDVNGEWLHLAETVEGNGISATASYIFSPYRYITNPGVELSVKGDVQYNHFSANTVFSVLRLDTISRCDPVILHEKDITEKTRFLSGIISLRADVYIGKTFSLYLEYSQSFLEKVNVGEKAMSYQGHSVHVPTHDIDFSKRVFTAGLAFHFLHNVPYKRKGAPLFPW